MNFQDAVLRENAARIDLKPVSTPSAHQIASWTTDKVPQGATKSILFVAALRQFLAGTKDFERYRVALVPSRDTSQALNPRTPESDLPLMILPLTVADFAELVGREKCGSPRSPEIQETRFGDVHVDFRRMVATRGGQEVFVTALEFKLLKFLGMNPERVISRAELLDHVWGYTNYPSTRTVDSRICSLRKKFEADPERPIHFCSVYSAGYRFVP